MKVFYKMAAGLLMALPAVSNAYAENVVITVPADFQVLGLSPNGKWACGVYLDAGQTATAFRWNLETDKVEILGDGSESIAWGIANDGTVSGNYMSSEVLPQGRRMQVVGINRPGKGWETLEFPENYNGGEGLGYSITPDGRGVSGSVVVNGIYTPYIWRDGKIYKNLSTGKHAMPYAISPDGEAAAGWAYGENNNRVSTYWKPEGTPVYLLDAPYFAESMFAGASAFSPDGSKIVYWGGWDPVGTESNALYCLYDIATDERMKVPTFAYDSSLRFFCIADNGLMGGTDSERALVYYNGECVYIDDFLKSINVDLSTFDDFYSGDDSSFGKNLPISRVSYVTPDAKTFIFLYFNKTGSMSSMCLKTDVDINALPPAGLTARHMEGTSIVDVAWKAPLGSKTARGYYVYRNGKRLNILPQSKLSYSDKNLAEGEYEYQIGFVSSAGKETKCDPVTVKVGPTQPAAPYGLYARNKGVNSALLDWEPVESGLLHKRYYNPATSKVSEFLVYAPVEMEAAILLPGSDLTYYNGATVNEVSFMPMSEHEAWKVVLYTRGTDGSLVELGSQDVTQPLVYGKLNTVKLANPVPVPSTDLYVAVRVVVKDGNEKVFGTVAGPSTPGVSDLLRLTEDPDFYSVYDTSIESGMYVSSMNWCIDAALQLPEGSNVVTRELDKYLVSCDGQPVGDTKTTSFEVPSMADGTYVFAVKALYTNGEESTPVEKSFEVKNSYLGASAPSINLSVESDNAEVTATWEAPVNNDRTCISYTTASKATDGIKYSENSMIIGALYTRDMLRSFDGYKIDNVKFYPMCRGIFTVYIYKNGTCIYEKEVDEIATNQWNEVKVDTDLLIDSHAEYTVAVDLFDAEPKMKMFGYDSALGYDSRSDLYSIDGGETWSTLSGDADLSRNWLLSMDIINISDEPVLPEGYDVVFDGKVINDSRVADTEYKFEAKCDNGFHTLAVNTYYTAFPQSVKGNNTMFMLRVSGISETAIADITLRTGQNTLVVEGDGVVYVDLTSIQGVKVASAAGNSVEISGLQPGVYVVSITTTNGVVTRKIRIN